MSVYSATEEQGTVELCAVVTNPQGGAPDVITISASTQDNTAGNTGMYVYMYVSDILVRTCI